MMFCVAAGWKVNGNGEQLSIDTGYTIYWGEDSLLALVQAILREQGTTE